MWLDALGMALRINPDCGPTQSRLPSCVYVADRVNSRIQVSSVDTKRPRPYKGSAAHLLGAQCRRQGPHPKAPNPRDLLCASDEYDAIPPGPPEAKSTNCPGHVLQA